MKIAVFADIHANLSALEAVLVDLQRQPVDGYIVAGDMATGPQPNQVIERLADLGAWMVQGNNEVYVLEYAQKTLLTEWWTYRQFGFARHSFHLVDGPTLEVIRQLPTQRVLELAESGPLRVVHGSPRCIDEMLFPDRNPDNLKQALELTPEAVLICGHTHIPWTIEQNGKLVLNPGAVTGGLNGDPRAHYAILNWDECRWQAELRAIAYDVAQVEKAFMDSGLLEEGGAFSRACLLSFRNSKNVPQDFVNFAYEFARQAGWQGKYIPDELLAEAEQKFNWDIYQF
ncbi:MAG: hypothetical protein H6Q37_821 [Chloroflexi bacterium]|nr:hypothetical protein [Chloroflexota bacterium]